MRDKDNRYSSVSRVSQLRVTLGLEQDVPDRERFVDEKYIRVGVCSDREPKRTYIPDEYCLTGLSMNSSNPAKSTMASNLSAVSSLMKSQDRRI